jgi:hypothetical protein
MTRLISLILVSLSVLTQNQPATRSQLPQRQVEGQTLISNEFPAARLTFGKDFRYVGGQVVNLYGNADAEQHLFVKAPNRGVVQRFYWVQFEHFCPRTLPRMITLQIGPRMLAACSSSTT